MSNKLQPLRGMKDLLPRDHNVQQRIIGTARAIGSLYGYDEISTPILEYTKVFDRTLGDTSDVVSKEMYSFLDKSNESIALRPEFTAGIIRAFISNGLQQDLPLKYFSAGPIFRYDRPQAGRQRQFHQFNFENIGNGSPYSDAETIKLASHILAELGISEDLTLEINSLGCYESRKNYELELKNYFTKHLDKLSEDSKKRLDTKPLRILDSKNETDKLIVLDAPVLDHFYTNEAADYFTKVKQYLNLLGVKYVVNPRLVRGFDYYCHTAFEFTTTKLGAQGTVLGGGRYDGLAKLMGGPDTPAIGFGAGIERIAMMREYVTKQPRSVYVLPISDECTDYGIDLANKLRSQQIHTIIDTQGKVTKRLQRAVDKNAKFAIFIGEEEMTRGRFKLKDLDNKSENELSVDEIIRIIKDF